MGGGRREGEQAARELKIPEAAGKKAAGRCAYPSDEGCAYSYAPAAGSLTVRMDMNTARLFEITLED